MLFFSAWLSSPRKCLHRILWSMTEMINFGTARITLWTAISFPTKKPLEYTHDKIPLSF